MVARASTGNHEVEEKAEEEEEEEEQQPELPASKPAPVVEEKKESGIEEKTAPATDIQKKKSQGAFKKPDMFKKKATNKDPAPAEKADLRLPKEEKKLNEEFKLEPDAVDVTESVLALKTDKGAAAAASETRKPEKQKEDPTPVMGGGESLKEEKVEVKQSYKPELENSSVKEKTPSIE